MFQNMRRERTPLNDMDSERTPRGHKKINSLGTLYTSRARADYPLNQVCGVVHHLLQNLRLFAIEFVKSNVNHNRNHIVMMNEISKMNAVE